jgi:L-fuconolactonase
MLTIDAQVHSYERDHPGRPWHAALTGPPEVTGDQMVAAMDAAGVDGAILVSAFTMYRYDASYALEVRSRHSGRFAVVKPVDPGDPAVADVIADWKRTPGTVGVRMLLLRRGYAEDPADPGLNRVVGRSSMPVNLHIAGRLDQGSNSSAAIPIRRSSSITSASFSHISPRCPRSPGRNCRKCWRSQNCRTLRLRSAALARCPTSPSLTRTSGTPSVASSTHSGSTDACGARTGRARSSFSPTRKGSMPSALMTASRKAIRPSSWAARSTRIYGWSPPRNFA